MAGARPDLRTTLGTVCEIQFVYGAAVPATVATVGADQIAVRPAAHAEPGLGRGQRGRGGARPERTVTGHRGTESRELP